MENENEKKNTEKPWLWKKGQSGNPLGRPKGKSMKEYVRQYLERMTDEERDEWLEGLPKELVWKMAEGNWRQDTQVEGEMKIDTLLVKFIDKNGE